MVRRVRVTTVSVPARHRISFRSAGLCASASAIAAASPLRASMPNGTGRGGRSTRAQDQVVRQEDPVRRRPRIHLPHLNLPTVDRSIDPAAGGVVVDPTSHSGRTEVPGRGQVARDGSPGRQVRRSGQGGGDTQEKRGKATCQRGQQWVSEALFQNDRILFSCQMRCGEAGCALQVADDVCIM